MSMTMMALYSLVSLADLRQVANQRLMAASSTKSRASKREQLIHSTTPRHLKNFDFPLKKWETGRGNKIAHRNMTLLKSR